jgi:hypothetical protein
VLIARSTIRTDSPRSSVAGLAHMVRDSPERADSVNTPTPCVIPPTIAENPARSSGVHRQIVCQITSQVSVVSAAKRLAFESVESEGMDYSSSKLDGIVWLPDEATGASLALTNTTAEELSVVGRTNQPGGSEAKTFTLGGHETRLVDVEESFGIKGVGVSALVSLEHTGAPGALIVTGFAANPDTGFSTNLVFSDRSTAVSTHLAGAHVRFGKFSAGEGFAPGTTFRAPLIIANAGSGATRASLFVDYTAGPRAGRIALGQINLAPGGLKQIDLSAEMARRGVAGPVDDAGIDVYYSGSPGSVIARLVSMDQTGDLAYDVPVKDPLAGGMTRATGGYPWRLDAGYTTVVHLKNTIDKPVEGIVQVRYEGGNYNPERIKLGPYQTVAVDIRQLRDAQQNDIRGGIMPEDVSSGQIKWLEIEPGSLIGRAEVANIREGVASSFSCSSSGCGAGYYSSTLSPSSLTGLAGDTASVSAQETDRDSNGTLYGPYNETGSATWSSSDTSVATVTGGSVSFVGAGSCSISANWNATEYVGPNCSTQTVTAGGGAGVTSGPKITSLDVTRGAVGGAYVINIKGTGFGSSPSVSVGGSGVTVSDTAPSDGMTVNTTFTIAENAAGGNHGVTVTASRQTSNSVNFYVQIPKSLRQDRLSDLVPVTNGTIDGVANQCGAYRTVNYSVMDQDTTPQVLNDSSASITETFANFNAPPGVKAPRNKTVSLTNSAFADTLAFSTDAPTCPPAFSSSVTQSFYVMVGQTKYNLTTSRTVSMSSDGNGNYTITVQ